MLDVDFSAIDRRSEDIASQGAEKPKRRNLVMMPESFFSLRFRMHVEEGETEKQRHSEDYYKSFHRLIYVNLLLLILFIGVPVLAYCMLSSVTH